MILGKRFFSKYDNKNLNLILDIKNLFHQKLIVLSENPRMSFRHAFAAAMLFIVLVFKWTCEQWKQ